MVKQTVCYLLNEDLLCSNIQMALLLITTESLTFSQSSVSTDSVTPHFCNRCAFMTV